MTEKKGEETEIKIEKTNRLSSWWNETLISIKAKFQKKDVEAKAEKPVKPVKAEKKTEKEDLPAEALQMERMKNYGSVVLVIFAAFFVSQWIEVINPALYWVTFVAKTVTIVSLVYGFLFNKIEWLRNKSLNLVNLEGKAEKFSIVRAGFQIGFWLIFCRLFIAFSIKKGEDGMWYPVCRRPWGNPKGEWIYWKSCPLSWGDFINVPLNIAMLILVWSNFLFTGWWLGFNAISLFLGGILLQNGINLLDKNGKGNSIESGLNLLIAGAILYVQNLSAAVYADGTTYIINLKSPFLQEFIFWTPVFLLAVQFVLKPIILKWQSRTPKQSESPVERQEMQAVGVKSVGNSGEKTKTAPVILAKDIPNEIESDKSLVDPVIFRDKIKDVQSDIYDFITGNTSGFWDKVPQVAKEAGVDERKFFNGAFAIIKAFKEKFEDVDSLVKFLKENKDEIMKVQELAPV